MVTRLKLRSWRSRSWWQSGGALVLTSLGMHGLLLGMPMPDSTPPEEPITLLPTTDSPATVGVVRIPAAEIIIPSPPEPELASLSIPSQVEEPKPPVQPAVSVPPEPTPSVLSEEATSPPLSELTPEDRPPGLVYNNQVKALRTDTQSFLEWYGSQNWGDNPDQVPLPGPKELDPLRVSYTLSPCLVPPPAPGRLEVIVTANGELMRSPRLLATTGYDDLDALAVEQAAQQNFAEAANATLPNPTVYWLPVDVRYDGATCQP